MSEDDWTKKPLQQEFRLMFEALAEHGRRVLQLERQCAALEINGHADHVLALIDRMVRRTRDPNRRRELEAAVIDIWEAKWQAEDAISTALHPAEEVGRWKAFCQGRLQPLGLDRPPFR